MNDEEKKSGGSPLIAVALALLVAGGGGTYYFYNQYTQSQDQLMAAKTELEDQGGLDVQSIVDEVGELMELPTDETPTIATIRTTENLADHPFLSRGEIGDRLLIFTGARQVIMYRPSTGKIVAVGSVTIQQEEGGVPGEATPSGELEGDEQPGTGDQPGAEGEQPGELGVPSPVASPTPEPEQ